MGPNGHASSQGVLVRGIHRHRERATVDLGCQIKQARGNVRYCRDLLEPAGVGCCIRSCREVIVTAEAADREAISGYRPVMRLSSREEATRAGALALVAALSGCGAFTPHGCTAIGADPGVTVTLAGNGWTVPLTVEVCVTDNCSSSPAVTSTAHAIFIRNTGLTSRKPTDVVITVRAEDGTILAPPTHSIVSPNEFQPNGPGCEPTVWVAAVTVTRQT